MVLNFDQTLDAALEDIGYKGEHQEWDFHQEERHMRDMPKEYRDKHYRPFFNLMFIEIPTMLNERFREKLKKPFSTFLGMNQEHDFPHKFLWEAHANTTNHSQYGFASQMYFWLGENGFMLALEQKGNGFDAVQVDKKGIKQHEESGGGFKRYRSFESEIFFDSPTDARTVYMKHKF